MFSLLVLSILLFFLMVRILKDQPRLFLIKFWKQLLSGFCLRYSSKIYSEQLQRLFWMSSAEILVIRSSTIFIGFFINLKNQRNCIHNSDQLIFLCLQSVLLQKMQDPLLIVRNSLAEYSLKKAQERIRKEKQMMEAYDEIEMEAHIEQKLTKQLGFNNISTQYGDTSSTTRVKFSGCGKWCGTAGSSGVCTIWNIQDEESSEFCTEKCVLKGQTKVCDIDFHPKLGDIPVFAPNIITGNTLGEIQFWTFDPALPEQKKFTLKAHTDRINATKFHPNGTILFSASYDKSWSIWDCTKLKELSNQKGHQYEIHSLSIHPDGALIFTGDLERYGMCWDLRTGKGIYELEVDNSITCSSFHPNGYQIAVSGKSNMIDIFDIRHKIKLKSIPAHCKLISDVKYNESGTILFSASHDNTVKLWHGLNYMSVGEELEHSSKITSIDLSHNKVAVSMIDKKWAMWSSRNNNQQPVKMEPS